MFDVGVPEMLALAVIALLVFGPERLPEAALQAARLVKKLRAMAQSARTDFGADFEPHLRELQELRQLNPRKIVRDYVLDPADGDGVLSGLMKGGTKPRPSSSPAGKAAAAGAGAAAINRTPGSDEVPDRVGPNGEVNGTYGGPSASADDEAPVSSGTAAAPANGHGQGGPAVPMAMAAASRAGPPPFDPDAT